MIRALSAAVLACGLGIGILGCQDQSGNPNNNADNTYPSSGTNGTGTYDSGNTHGGMNSGTGADRPGSNSRESTGGFINNSGSMSKEQPSTQPQ